MAITRVGVATAAATTVAIPTHVAGDIIVVCATHFGAITIPTMPSGFNQIGPSKTGTLCGQILAYKWATGTGDTSGTWTNATIIACAVWRASSGNVMGIGASAFTAQATLSVNFPALTLADGFSGNTWVGGFIAVAGTAQVCTVAPTGMTNESSLVSTNSVAGFDTNGGVTTWPSTNATDTGTASHSISCTFELMLLPGTPQPSQVVQHIGGGSNPYSYAIGDGTLGNNYLLPFTDPVGAGNCLIIGITYANGLTVAVSDNINGAWGAPTTHANAGTGNDDSAIYVFPNSAAGKLSINVAFSAPTEFQYSQTEFTGVDPSPSAGSTNTAFVAGPAAAAGSFTPTNNDATGGNIIWAYAALSQTNPTNLCPNIRAGQNMTLLDADIGWTVPPEVFYHASASYVQTAHAAINPTIVFIGDTDQFNCCAVALKLTASAGTPRATPTGWPTSGGCIRICHFTTTALPATGNYNIQAPVVGNCRVIACTDNGNLSNTLVVTDNEGGTWSGSSTTTGSIYYRVNTTSNSDLQIIITNTGDTNRDSWRIYDIVGADVSPFDSAGLSGQTVSSVTSFTMSPTPTPTSTKGIVIANVGLGQGPGAAITSPAGAAWVLCTYGGSNTFTQTSTNNFVLNDTMQIGNNTFQFVAAIGVLAGDVLIGANFAASAANLVSAIMGTAGAGTTYIAPTNVPNVTAYSGSTFPGSGLIVFLGTLLNNLGSAGVPPPGFPSVYTATGTAAGSFSGTSPFITESDFDIIEDADLSAVYYYTASGAQTWTWTISSISGNSTSGGWIVLKAATDILYPQSIM